MIKNRKLDHLGMAVDNVEAAKDWYVSVLGGEVIGTFYCEGDPNAVYFVRVGEVVYEMYQEPVPADARGKIDHVAYLSEDIEADYAFCVSKGYTITTNGIEALPTFWDNGCRYFKILSPTGEQVEFSQKC
ncbi:MAG: VOC family protein [Clostridia bacterium]|jgi:catechol 2,3-dioxygenase-like lactoylglutathione lyase family enzyme|nr:VOC family protein [Clostridia bacterium]